MAYTDKCATTAQNISLRRNMLQPQKLCQLKTHPSMFAFVGQCTNTMRKCLKRLKLNNSTDRVFFMWGLHLFDFDEVHVAVPAVAVFPLRAPRPPEMWQVVWLWGIWMRWKDKRGFRQDRLLWNLKWQHRGAEDESEWHRRVNWPSGGGLVGDGMRRGASCLTATEVDFRSGRTLIVKQKHVMNDNMSFNLYCHLVIQHKKQ